MELYVGIDLHTNNNYLAIIDVSDTRVYKKKITKSTGCNLGRTGTFSE